MKKFYFIILLSPILFMGCNNTSPNVDTNTKLVKVDASSLGIENTSSNNEIAVTYDAHDEKVKKYNQLQEIEAENKRNDEKEFKAFIREEERK